MKGLSGGLLLCLGLIVLMGMALYLWSARTSQSELPSAIATPGDTGLQRVDCWFEALPAWPAHECYEMSVPENHADAASRLIVFPVLVFRAAESSAKAPVLHLGGGGPGGALYLDSQESVQQLLDGHDGFSLQQGRDLWLMDPRGAGLARPELVCHTFNEAELQRLAKPLTLAEEWQQALANYRECIVDYQRQGYDLSQYNSLAVSEDVEMLRRSAGVQRWVLVGVSYGGIYAQLLAVRHAQTVEAMVLDSTSFPDIKLQHELAERSLKPFTAIYDYCAQTSACSVSRSDTEQRFWNLYKQLNRQPLSMQALTQLADGSSRMVPLVLTGDRFVMAMLIAALYGEALYADVPAILDELERGDIETFENVANVYVLFQTDRHFADISMLSHYCYEILPFSDPQAVQQELQQLPPGFIRESTDLGIQWLELCKLIKTEPAPPHILAMPTQTTVPTLFLHGDYDSVTPLQDVRQRQRDFSNSHIKSWPLSHAVLGIDDCVELTAAQFVASPRAPLLPACQP